MIIDEQHRNDEGETRQLTPGNASLNSAQATMVNTNSLPFGFSKLPSSIKPKTEIDDDNKLIVEFDDPIRSTLPPSNHGSWRQAICTESPRTAETRARDDSAWQEAHTHKPRKVLYLWTLQYLKRRAGNDHIEFTTSVESMGAFPVTFYRGGSSKSHSGRHKIGSGYVQLKIDHKRSVEYLKIVNGPESNPSFLDPGRHFFVRGNFDNVAEFKTHMHDLETIDPQEYWGSFPLDLPDSKWLNFDSRSLDLDPKYSRERNEHFVDVQSRSDAEDADLPAYRLTFKESGPDEDVSTAHFKRMIDAVEARRDTTLTVDFSNCVWDD